MLKSYFEKFQVVLVKLSRLRGQIQYPLSSNKNLIEFESLLFTFIIYLLQLLVRNTIFKLTWHLIIVKRKTRYLLIINLLA